MLTFPYSRPLLAVNRVQNKNLCWSLLFYARILANKFFRTNFWCTIYALVSIHSSSYNTVLYIYVCLFSNEHHQSLRIHVMKYEIIGRKIGYMVLVYFIYSPVERMVEIRFGCGAKHHYNIVQLLSKFMDSLGNNMLRFFFLLSIYVHSLRQSEWKWVFH